MARDDRTNDPVPGRLEVPGVAARTRQRRERGWQQLLDGRQLAPGHGPMTPQIPSRAKARVVPLGNIRGLGPRRPFHRGRVKHRWGEGATGLSRRKAIGGC